MVDTLFLLPPGFWAVVILLVAGGLWSLGQIPKGIGLPMIAVLLTAAAWYVGDVFYNDYQKNYMILFSEEVRGDAWWQVALFVMVFLMITPEVHRVLNASLLRRSSQVVWMFERGTGKEQFQRDLQKLLLACVGVWTILSVIALCRLQGDTLYYFAPYLSFRANPWERGRIGSGIDFLLSFAGYLELFVAVMFGIATALLTNVRMRLLALGGVVMTWPFFIFDRTRNTMLAILLPTILSWVFLRLRVPTWQKVSVLAVCFILINAWFAFVVSHRSSNTIAAAFAGEGFDIQQSSTVHHEGLNMYQELCWINTYIDNGAYKPNWGKRYFAEIVNPIPRTIWPDKPMIGIDYAILRGQAYDAGGAGVGATISTGMIGQGVVNFGTLLGPAFAAFLMSIWASLLARLDLHGQGLGRIPLFGLGLILTFNLGRDITFITLYTFIFGAMLVGLLEVTQGSTASAKKRPAPAAPPNTTSRPGGTKVAPGN